MIPKDPKPLIFSVLRDLYAVPEEELAGLDMEGYVTRLRSIHQGLSAEHEFAAIASWLGDPRLIVHTDEVITTDKHFRVPDFLVVARRDGKDIPFLVEVKSEQDKKKLVWSEGYLTSMRRFAKMLNLPLLIGWKTFGMWTLCDSELIEKNVTAYHLSRETAIKNNLMSALFGNVFIRVKDGFRLEIEYKLNDVTDSVAVILPEGNYEATITEMALYTAKGRLNSALTNELFPLFIARATDEHVTKRTGDRIREKYSTDSEGMFNASDLLFANTTFSSDPGEPIDWLVKLRKGLVKPAVNLPRVLDDGIDAGAIQYVLEQQPDKLPPFLEGIDFRIRKQ
ncbi:MAG TPA: hypothetical protein VGU25_07905 [Acidobacteriaceae bacterium]|nr:hypothetical protein [Acidobacteriaceae bacterium]